MSKMFRLLPYLVMLVVLLVFFNKIIFYDNIFAPGDFLRSDTFNQNLPFKFLLYQSLHKSELPLWTNLIYTGFPLVAEGQIGAFYPFNFLPFWALPFIKAYNVSQILNFTVAFLGMYVLVRFLKLSKISSFLCSVVYGLSGFLVVHITHQNIISSAVWLPLLFYCVVKFLESSVRKFAVLGSLVVALQIFGGSLQIVFYSQVSLLLFVAVTSFFSNKQKTKKSFLIVKDLGKVTVVILLGILIASVQLVPSLELVEQSTRQNGLGNIALDSLPYHPRNLITFIFPYYFGDSGNATYPHFGNSWGMFWENTGYVGILPLLLVLLAVLGLWRINIKVKAFAILAVLALLFTLGKYSPLAPLFYLPLFNSFRVPSRFLLVVTFSLSILAGFGLDFVLQKFKRFGGLSRGLGVIVVLVSLADLFHFGYNYNPVVSAGKVLSSPPMAKIVSQGNLPRERIYSIGATNTYDVINKDGGWRNNLDKLVFHRNALDPDVNMLFGVSNSDGYSGLFLERNAIFNYLVDQGITIRQNEITISEQSLKLLGLQNVGYIVSSFNLSSNGVELLSQVEDLGISYKIYRNKHVLPRAFVFNDFTNTTFPQSFNDLLHGDLRKKVFVEGAFLPSRNMEEKAGQGMVKFLVDQPLQVKLEVNATEDGWLFLADTFYPDWRVFVDQKESVVFPANGMFRAVQVPSGQSIVEFRYAPMSFFLGAAISVVTLLSLGVLAIIRKSGGFK